MDYLNKTILNTIADVPEKEIEIPEWDAKIRVKGISKKVQVELARIASDESKDAFDYKKNYLKLV